MQKEQKRKDILEAALRLLVEQGFHGAPMAMIARSANVATGTVYCYFASRDDLIHAVQRSIEEQIQTAIGPWAEGESLPGRHRQICQTLLQFFIDNPREFRYLEQFHNSPYGIELRRERLYGKSGTPDTCRDFFSAAVAADAIRNLPLVILYSLTFGPLLMAARNHILGFVELDQSLIEEIVGCCWESIRV